MKASFNSIPSCQVYERYIQLLKATIACLQAYSMVFMTYQGHFNNIGKPETWATNILAPLRLAQTIHCAVEDFGPLWGYGTSRFQCLLFYLEGKYTQQLHPTFTHPFPVRFQYRWRRCSTIKGIGKGKGKAMAR